MEPDTSMDSNKRRAERLQLGLLIQARVGGGTHIPLEMIDISASGMQIRTEDFDILQKGFDAQHNSATFEIRLVARLAWARPEDDGSFLTGWEFNLEDEDRIG